MRKKFVEDYNSKSPSKFSFVLLLCISLLLIINIINVYSAGFSVAENLGKKHSYYLFSQTIFTVVAIIVAIITSKFSENIVKYSSPLVILICFCILFVGCFTEVSIIKTQIFMHLVFLSSIVYFCVFFSNRDNSIASLKDMIVPCVFAIALTFLTLVNNGFAYSIAYLFMTVVVFIVCGVGVLTIVLYVLYAMIPVSVYFLTSSERINAVLGFLVPGLYTEATNTLSFTSKAAISSGELLGKGLGEGEYKYIFGKEILSEYSFCSFAEEMGFIGVCAIFVILVFYIVTVFVRAKAIKEENLLISDLCYCLGTLLSFQVFSNLLFILGIVPFEGTNFPFLAFGPEVIIFMLEFSLVLRSCRTNDLKQDELDELDEDLSN